VNLWQFRKISPIYICVCRYVYALIHISAFWLSSRTRVNVWMSSKSSPIYILCIQIHIYECLPSSDARANLWRSEQRRPMCIGVFRYVYICIHIYAFRSIIACQSERIAVQQKQQKICFCIHNHTDLVSMSAKCYLSKYDYVYKNIFTHTHTPYFFGTLYIYIYFFCVHKHTYLLSMYAVIGCPSELVAVKEK